MLRQNNSGSEQKGIRQEGKKRRKRRKRRKRMMQNRGTGRRNKKIESRVVLLIGCQLSSVMTTNPALQRGNYSIIQQQFLKFTRNLPERREPSRTALLHPVQSLLQWMNVDFKLC